MHWLGCNDAVPWLNKVKTRIFQPTATVIFKISKLTCILSACLPACLPACPPKNPVTLGVGLQKFHKIKVMAQIYENIVPIKDNLPSAPWRFLLSLSTLVLIIKYVST